MENLAEMGDSITSLEKEIYIEEMYNENTENISGSETEETQSIATYAVQPEISVSSVISGYNNTAAVNYATKYAITPNSAYADFSNDGGDCTNFISQCLYAGGIKQHVGTALTAICWYYKTSTNRSSSWTGAQLFRKYLNSDVTKISKTKSTWSEVVPGDIIQLLSSGSAYHSLIVTGIVSGANGRSDLLVCAHSSNRRNVSLAQYYSGNKVYHKINGSK